MWKIGICTDFKDHEKMTRLKEMGFDFFEFGFSSIGNADPADVDAAVEKVKELGIPVASMNGLIPAELKMTGPDADHDKVAAFVEKTLKRAVRFGTRNYVLGSGGARSVPEGFSQEEATRQLQSLFSEKLVPIFAKYDCILSIEELRKEECNIFNSCKEVMKSIKAVEHPNLRLLVDYYHAVLGGDTMEELASYKGYISHVHIASPLNGRHVPAEGDGEDYAGFFEALKKAEYAQKNISLEGSFGDDYYGAAQEALRYLRTFS